MLFYQKLVASIVATNHVLHLLKRLGSGDQSYSFIQYNFFDDYQ